jgi:hypothetical protein
LEKNKALIRKVNEALNRKDLTILDEFMAPDYVDHTNQLHGKEEVSARAQGHARFPQNHRGHGRRGRQSVDPFQNHWDSPYWKEGGNGNREYDSFCQRQGCGRPDSSQGYWAESINRSSILQMTKKRDFSQSGSRPLLRSVTLQFVVKPGKGTLDLLV